MSIGMGWPAAAADFRDTHEVPFPVLVDRKKETYRALQIQRGNVWEVAGPSVWLRTVRSLVTGRGIDIRAKQDPFQLGGVIVADKGGEILYSYRSKSSSDNPPTGEVIAALP